MAKHLAELFGTEEDRVNCSFYFKIGACRHGDQCSRNHNRPVMSQCLLLKNMYQNPPAAIALAEGHDVNDDTYDQVIDHFETFYEEVFRELTTYGEIEDMCVVDNISDHLIGSVYVRYSDETAAERALQKLTGRFYAGRVIMPEYCPVSDFADARCKQYDDAQCARGGYCNFIHWKHVPRAVRRRLYRQMYKDHPDYGQTERERGRRRSRSRGRGDRGGRGGERGGRQTSEERRAMIAQWNKSREAGVDESLL